MARGRFIAKSISDSQTFNELPDDFTRLLWLMLIPHLDREGRFYGHARLVGAKIMPWRLDITDEQVEAALRSLEDAGYIERYGSGQFLHAPNFHVHQQGLRKDREAPSIFPCPPGGHSPPGERSGTAPEELLTDSGPAPDLLRPEDKGQDQDEAEPQDQHQQQGSTASSRSVAEAGFFLRSIGIGPPALHQLSDLELDHLEELWEHCQARPPAQRAGLFVHLARSGFRPPARPGSVEAERKKRYALAQSWIDVGANSGSLGPPPSSGQSSRPSTGSSAGSPTGSPTGSPAG